MAQLIKAGIVIIGGGQAGGWVAKTLKDEGYQGILSVISDKSHDFHERPLYQRHYSNQKVPNYHVYLVNRK